MYGIMCHYYTDIIINLDVSADLTNGVTAMVNTASAGELLGIRVTYGESSLSISAVSLLL